MEAFLPPIVSCPRPLDDAKGNLLRDTVFAQSAIMVEFFTSLEGFFGCGVIHHPTTVRFDAQKFDLHVQVLFIF